MSDTVAVMAGGRIIQSGAPREVYGSPESRAVADFLGSANLIRGKVIEVFDGVVSIGLGDSRITVPVSLANLVAGESVDVVFRPEYTPPSRTV